MSDIIMIVDDEPSQLRMAEYAIKTKLNYQPVCVASGEEALQWLRSARQPAPDIMLLDMVMPGVGGLHVIREAKRIRPDLPVIVISQYGEEAHAAEALETGACDFLTKPIVLERLKLSVQNALTIQRMSSHIARLERKVAGHVALSDVLGNAPALKEALALGSHAAHTKMPVWIEGEYGTGRELLARAIHGSGERAGKPFVTLDCKALPEEGAEAVLFGDERTLGKLREAEGGTLLLKEVGHLSLAAQRRLLGLIENGTTRPSGAQAKAPDVRLICATSERMDPLTSQGRFSQSLYKHLRGIPIDMPPLRDRKQDIPLLARHLVSEYAAAENKAVYGISEQAVQQLASSSWPGNIRQLSHLLWRALLVCERGMIDVAELQLVQKQGPSHYGALPGDMVSGGNPLLDMQGQIRKLKSIEEEAIRFALQYSNGCMTRAARSLGIGRSTLYRRVSELSIDAHIARENHTTRPMIKMSSAERS